jgi:CzcA family heavy metal efflux pump
MIARNRILAIFAVVALSVLGVLVAFSIPSAVFPEIQFNRATVLIEAGDLPAEQMLVMVTRPVEEAAYGVAGVVLVRSTTSRGSAEMDVNFREGADSVATFELLNAALSEVRPSLPANAKIESHLLTSGTYPVIQLSLSSATRDLASLTDIAAFDLVPSLHRINGVYRVDIVGGKAREYVVELDAARMLQHGLTSADVVTGLSKANVVETAGRVQDEHRNLLTVVTSDLHGADQLEAAPVATVNNQPVYVRDIAKVELGIVEDYIRTSSEHGPAVLVAVSQQPTGNTVEIASETHALIDEFRARYPDVHFSFAYDQAVLVTESFKSVRDAIVLGLALAVAVVFLFTWSLLNAVIAAIVVPSTIAITFVVMSLTGMTFNMMTLGGLAAGIGLFIDDAIVMIEAIHRAHAGGAAGDAAVGGALQELVRPLIASTATVIVVFAPLIFVSGVTGVFFRALAITLGGGLLVSLALALFFTPALELIVERFRRSARAKGRVAERMNRLYLGTLRPFLRAPILAPVVAVAAFAATFFLYQNIGSDYLPALDEGGFILDYITPPESTLEETGQLLAKIENILRATPEVAAFSRRTGTQLGYFLTESNRGDMSVRLKENRSRDIYAVMDGVRKQIERSLPNVEVEFSQILQDLIGDLSGQPQPIVVKVFGADQNAIEATAKQIATRISSLPGILEVKNGIVLSNPEEQVLIDHNAAARYGFSADDILNTLRNAVFGTVATQLRIGDRLYGVRVRYPAEFHQNLSLLPQVLMRTAAGGLVPLSSLTTHQFIGERPELDRERLRPVVYVTGRVENIDLGTAIEEVKANLATLQLPAGVTVEYGGLYSEQQKAFHQLALVLIAALVAMFLVLLWEFRRLTPAIAILLSAVACLMGSFVALELSGLTLNISSFMGIIMVTGITAKNGILLLDHAEREESAIVSARQAVIDAARIRLRPILMTTLATAAGLLPLALGMGAGAKVQQPLAVAVIGGLIVAVALSTPLAGGIYLMGTRRRS